MQQIDVGKLVIKFCVKEEARHEGDTGELFKNVYGEINNPRPGIVRPTVTDITTKDYISDLISDILSNKALQCEGKYYLTSSLYKVEVVEKRSWFVEWAGEEIDWKNSK